MESALRAGLPALGLQLSDGQLAQLCQYGAALLEKNQVMNLTAITEPEAVARLHFLDCLALLKLADFSGASVIDIGCGAGFPGVPLKIGEPSIRLTLLDSLGKRMRWLEQELLPELGLAFLADRGRHPADMPIYRRIHLDAMVDPERLRALRGRLRERARLSAALRRDAELLLAEAKAMHDDLERFYNPHVDFDGIYALAREHMDWLLGKTE